MEELNEVMNELELSNVASSYALTELRKVVWSEDLTMFVAALGDSGKDVAKLVVKMREIFNAYDRVTESQSG